MSQHSNMWCMHPTVMPFYCDIYRHLSTPFMPFTVDIIDLLMCMCCMLILSHFPGIALLQWAIVFPGRKVSPSLFLAQKLRMTTWAKGSPPIFSPVGQGKFPKSGLKMEGFLKVEDGWWHQFLHICRVFYLSSTFAHPVFSEINRQAPFTHFL